MTLGTLRDGNAHGMLKWSGCNCPVEVEVLSSYLVSIEMKWNQGLLVIALQR